MFSFQQSYDDVAHQKLVQSFVYNSGWNDDDDDNDVWGGASVDKGQEYSVTETNFVLTRLCRIEESSTMKHVTAGQLQPSIKVYS